MIAIPDSSEVAEYYFTYINQVPRDRDVLDVLETQEPETVDLLRSISEARSRQRYAPGKWTVREAVAHVNDTERLFVFRAFWFARGLDEPLPSFDQDVAARENGADDRALSSHIDEFRVIRAASLAFFRGLPSDAWLRRGIASGNPFSVRALAFITAGHLAHHNRILREKYLV
jgi:hypothetical protein